MNTIYAEHVFLDQTPEAGSTLAPPESMQNNTLQRKVKRFRARRREVVHQQCQLDRQQMIAQGWQVYSWGEIGKDLFGRLIVEAIYMR
jgi:hypothetical protein